MIKNTEQGHYQVVWRRCGDQGLEVAECRTKVAPRVANVGLVKDVHERGRLGTSANWLLGRELRPPHVGVLVLALRRVEEVQVGLFVEDGLERVPRRVGRDGHTLGALSSKGVEGGALVLGQPADVADGRRKAAVSAQRGDVGMTCV